MKPLRPSILLAALAACLPGTALALSSGELLERVSGVLERGFYDKEFRRHELPDLVERFRPRAEAARGDEERTVVHEFLAEIPVSHLALFSKATYRHMRAELAGKSMPTLGMQLTSVEGGFFVDWLFAGGVAERAGLLRGDAVVAIDGVATARSPRLDWRSDDAALPDPPIHRVICSVGEEVELTVERRPGVRAAVRLVAEPYSGLEASKSSIRVEPRDERRFGYVRLWYIHMSGVGKLVRQGIEGPFAECDGLVVDLRGRGGSAAEVERIVKVLDKEGGAWGRPLVLLVDRGTRSAKEVLAHELRSREAALVVGERTAGAVVPAVFKDVGSDSVLMYPAFTLGHYTRDLEGKGVEPDVTVEDELAYSAGRDLILEAGFLALDAWCAELDR